MRCSKCGTDNREGRKFCAECGETLDSKCPRCGATNESREKFCGECGGVLSTSGVDVDSSESASSTPVNQVPAGRIDEGTTSKGERRHLTVLFCDLVNSTQIA